MLRLDCEVKPRSALPEFVIRPKLGVPTVTALPRKNCGVLVRLKKSART